MKKKKIPTQIHSVSSYIRAVFALQENQSEEQSNSSFWFFRGQKNSLWPMTSAAFRNNALSIEFEAIESALRQRPYDFRECKTDFEILTKLQHYGLGTRLLDVTLNPLVALYFASEPYEDIVDGKNGQSTKVARDGKIVYHYGYGHKITELGVKIGCALPFLDFQQHYTLRNLVDDLKGKGIISAEDHSLLCANSYEKLLEFIQSNSFVVSSYSNERLVRQSGSFVVPTLIKIYENTEDLGESVIRKTYSNLDGEFDKHCFIVPSGKKEKIRAELDFLNINEATLFPELEHQLVYLQKKRPAKIGSVEMFERYTHNSVAISQPVVVEEHHKSYEAPKPNIDEILDLYLGQSPELKVAVQSIIEDGISVTDWWSRDTILSQIKRNITRCLQKENSVTDSKNVANHIVESLLRPDTK